MKKSKLYQQIREVIIDEYQKKPGRVLAHEMNTGVTKVYNLIRGHKEYGVELDSINVTPDLEDALEKWGYRIELVKEE